MTATVRLDEKLEFKLNNLANIIPLSTSLIDDTELLRMRITKREDLEKDSDIVVTQIRAIDNNRFMQKLATLTPKE